MLSSHPETPSSSGICLVCGLGSLGQNCVSLLKDFGVMVHAIDPQPPTHWDVAALPDRLDQLIIGDS
jgi:lactate dehydrogenase-like 2-hydroxyacid dehydrogenase